MHTVYTRYLVGMDDTPAVGAREARAELGKLIDAAHYGGQHTILTKSDQPRAVLVPYEWWREQQNRPG